MPSSDSKIIKLLSATFPVIRFVPSDDTYWSASKKTIYYASLGSSEDIAVLLHETGHALLGHFDYSSDVALLRYEADAWEQAKNTLAPLVDIHISQEVIEDHIDTYRDWLQARSTCPECSQTGLQTKTSTYQCVNCQCSWLVNDARRCQLRRKVVAS